MTRSQKISKLANAIRSYRGLYHANTKEWIHYPQQKSANRVRIWLERLQIDFEEAFRKIDGFKNLDEFRAWLNSL